MNVTELARQVKLSTKQLRALLPELGFDIGARAIKIDAKVAQTVIQKLSSKREREKYLQLLEEDTPTAADEEAEKTSEEKEARPENEITLPERVVVKDLAKLLNVNVTKLVVELMRQGVMGSLNDSIDFETASIVAEDFGFTVVRGEETDDASGASQSLNDFLTEEDKEAAAPRPPVVVVMGHVDHGKTTLLDAVRETNVVSGESGGITQHIGAYQVEVPDTANGNDKKDKKGKKQFAVRKLTFIDTPGHEAFSMMRSRGARVADLAILVVAADDGVQPQTVEAVSHIKSSGLPFLVAINKMDKPESNPDKIKKELSDLGVVPEDWGGETMMLPISAKEGDGIPELLESLLLLAEVDKDSIVANPNGLVLGTIIESHVDKGAGPIATILVRNGTLSVGDQVIVGDVPGKIRSMSNWQGEAVKQAPPSMPVVVLGLKQAPGVGDVFKAVEKNSEYKKTARQFKKQAAALAMRSSASQQNTETQQSVKVILRADVLGSLEAIQGSFNNLDSSDIRIEVINQGVGYITEKDVIDGADTNALVLGFHAFATPEAEELARTKGVSLKSFEVIYDLLDYVAEEATKMIAPEVSRNETGRIQILKVFRKEKTFSIVGGRVTKGEIFTKSKLALQRAGTVIDEGVIGELQSGKEEVTVVAEGQECGLKFTGTAEIEPGDELIAFTEETTEKKITL